jgi:hypothetical protein
MITYWNLYPLIAIGVNYLSRWVDLHGNYCCKESDFEERTGFQVVEEWSLGGPC